ncbi:hypothetical protein FSARC_7659 [Fusarium sarcochroum]|uniref:phospholipase A2 n=1 Tax=Fusarium sarcochroum TaxID=1208366 RepID=A0A8H4TUZ0_9HYPO|nr:hypothetical protein FSARC_7659 [Fusarium sarcochroum]
MEPSSEITPAQHSQTPPERGLRVLSLACSDGGGVRGLSSLYILRHLMKRIDSRNPPKPCDYFDIIGGTSTGGLIAIMLGRLRMSIADCIKKYEELSDDVFKPKRQLNIFGKAKDIWKLDGAFDALELEAATKIVIQYAGMDSEDKLVEHDPQCKVFVLAMRSEITRPVRLRNYETPLTVQEVDCTIVEAVRATSAASSFFSPVTIEGQTFIDAAVGYNNPVDEVLEEVYQVWAGPNSSIERFVSVGTGIPRLNAFGKNFLALGKSLVKIATDTQKAADKFERDAVRANGLSGIYFRFNARGMEGVGLEDTESKGTISAATNNYLNEFETLKKINEFAAVVPSFLSKTQQHAYLRSLRTYDVLSELGRVAEPMPGTFAWVMDTPEFISWCGKDAGGHPVLHILGKPGCGKSVLLAWLRQNVPGSCIAFFACKHSEHIRRSPEMILSSLLRQILTQQPNLFRYVVPMTSCLETWTYAQLWASLKSVLTSPDNTGIICLIDALDECLKETQKQFIKDIRLLSDLIAQRRSRGFTRLVITSRNYVDLHIPSAMSLNLDKRPEMDKDLETFIAAKVEELVSLRPQYDDLAELIICRLQDRASGMYRLVELVIEELYLISDSSKDSILATLRSVPDDISKLYDNIWERLGSLHRARARSILAWILCSFTPLNIHSLNHVSAALATPQNMIHKIESNISKDLSGDLVRLLGPLISVESIVEVSHPSVKDHFLDSEVSTSQQPSTNSIRSSEAHTLIALTCLRYLNSFPAKPHDYSTRGFVSYALTNFARHVARSGDDGIVDQEVVDQEIITFFERDVWSNDWQQLIPHDMRVSSAIYVPRIHDAISFACYYGRSRLVNIMLTNKPESVSCSEGICAKETLRLVYLALVGLQKECLQQVTTLFDKMLFKPGLSVRFFDMAFRPYTEKAWPLLSPTISTLDGVAEYIHSYQMHNQQFQRTDDMRYSLQRDIKHAFDILCPYSAASDEQDLLLLRSHDWSYSTAVIFSQYMLSTYGPDSIDILRAGSDALLEAVSSNRTQATEFLISAGADLRTLDDTDRSLLHMAAGTGNEKVVNLILQRRSIDINSPDNWGKTPLHYACSRYDLWDCAHTLEPRPPYISRAKVVALLLRSGANRKIQDLRGNTAFQTLGHFLVPDWDDIPKCSDLNWREDDLNETIAILMQDLSDVVAWDHRGATILHQAAHKWPVSAVEQLLQFLWSFRVSACLIDHQGHTPLHYAALRGFDSPEKVIEVLCQAGVDPRLRQVYDGSALKVARSFSRLSCAKELIKWEKEFDSKDTAASTSSWLKDKFGSVASNDQAHLPSKKPSVKRRRSFQLVVFAAPQHISRGKWPLEATELESEHHIYPSMKAGLWMSEMAALSSPNSLKWKPTVLSRHVIEGLSFMHLDGRLDGFSQLVDESLSRPMSRKRLEQFGILNKDSTEWRVVQDENFYSPLGTQSQVPDNYDSTEEYDEDETEEQREEDKAWDEAGYEDSIALWDPELDGCDCGKLFCIICAPHPKLLMVICFTVASVLTICALVLFVDNYGGEGQREGLGLWG